MTRLACLAAAIAYAVPLAASAPLAGATPLPADAYSNRLAQLTEIERRAALRSAIGESGEYCKRLEGATPRGRYRNLVMWTAICDRGASYGVFIGPDGSVQVRPCADLPKLRLPKCA